MAKLISNRIYLDYNATSPLADSVKEYLARGDFSYGNASSMHMEGRNSRRLIIESKDYLFDLFSLEKEKFEIFFHSGATEALNSIVKGLAMHATSQKKQAHFFYSTVDHSSVVKQALHLPWLGHKAHACPVDNNGQLLVDKLIQDILKVTGPDSIVLFNFTQVNNETGVVWPLQIAAEIKKRTGCLVHVDAVQAPGKITGWNNLNFALDAYTYSAHKFGAMKGVGFTFISDHFPWIPLHAGGGQQKGLRSGTENVLGIYSIKLALIELINNFDCARLLKMKLRLESTIKSLLPERVIIVGENAPYRNANTTNVVIKKSKSDSLVSAFDLKGIAVSTGSACSTGASVPSRILLEMGLSEEFAKQALRFSLPPNITDQEIEGTEKVMNVIFSSLFQAP